MDDRFPLRQLANLELELAELERLIQHYTSEAGPLEKRRDEVRAECNEFMRRFNITPQR